MAELEPGELYPGLYADYDPHEVYPPTPSNVTVVRDARLATALRIDARNRFAEMLSAAGYEMLPSTVDQWYGSDETRQETREGKALLP